jgi:hypothetical protein
MREILLDMLASEAHPVADNILSTEIRLKSVYIPSTLDSSVASRGVGCYSNECSQRLLYQVETAHRV